MFRPQKDDSDLYKGLESLKKGQVVELKGKEFRAYARIAGVDRGWLTAEALVWTPCESGERLHWKKACYATDEIGCFSLATEEEASRATETYARHLSCVGKYISLTLGQSSHTGKVVKAYRDGLTLSPFLDYSIGDPKINQLSKHVAFGTLTPQMEIVEMLEDVFQKLPEEFKKVRKEAEDKKKEGEKK